MSDHAHTGINFVEEVTSGKVRGMVGIYDVVIDDWWIARLHGHKIGYVILNLGDEYIYTLGVFDR